MIFNIVKNPKYDGYHYGLASMVYKFFDKKPTSLVDKSTSGGTVKIEVISKRISKIITQTNYLKIY